VPRRLARRPMLRGGRHQHAAGFLPSLSGSSPRDRVLGPLPSPTHHPPSPPSEGYGGARLLPQPAQHPNTQTCLKIFGFSAEPQVLTPSSPARKTSANFSGAAPIGTAAPWPCCLRTVLVIKTFFFFLLITRKQNADRRVTALSLQPTGLVLFRLSFIYALS